MNNIKCYLQGLDTRNRYQQNWFFCDTSHPALQFIQASSSALLLFYPSNTKQLILIYSIKFCIPVVVSNRLPYYASSCSIATRSIGTNPFCTPFHLEEIHYMDIVDHKNYVLILIKTQITVTMYSYMLQSTGKENCSAVSYCNLRIKYTKRTRIQEQIQAHKWNLTQEACKFLQELTTNS